MRPLGKVLCLDYVAAPQITGLYALQRRSPDPVSQWHRLNAVAKPLATLDAVNLGFNHQESRNLELDNSDANNVNREERLS